MPRVEGATPEAPPIRFLDTGGRLSYLEVVNVADSGYGASCLYEGTLERVKLVAQGQDAIGLFQGPGCYLSDSLVRAEGPGAVALYITDSETSESEVTEDRNVTAVARGPDSIGAWLNFLGVGPIFKLSLVLHNSSPRERNTTYMGPEARRFPTTRAKFWPPIRTSTQSRSPIPCVSNTKTGAAIEAQRRSSCRPRTRRLSRGRRITDDRRRSTAGSRASRPRRGAEDHRRSPGHGRLRVRPGPCVHARGQHRGQAQGAEPRAGEVPPFLPGHGDKPPRPRRTTVSYRLSAPGHVRLTVEEMAAGRVVKGKCLRETRFNSYGKKCPLILPLRGSIGRLGKAGRNRFRFSGYLAGEPLPQGSYRLVGTAAGVTKLARFTILK